MEAVTGIIEKFPMKEEMERNYFKNKTYPLMITFSPSYLIRFPENKKYSWEDLKKLNKKFKI